MKKNITFTLPAEAVEGCSGAFLLGDFNNWNPDNAPRLEKQSDGSFKTSTQLEEGKTYQYRFLLDNGRWVNDYHAENYVPVSGLYVDNCVITVPLNEVNTNTQSAQHDTAESEKQSQVKKTRSTTKAAKTESPKAKKAKPAASKATTSKAAASKKKPKESDAGAKEKK